MGDLIAFAHHLIYENLDRILEYEKTMLLSNDSLFSFLLSQNKYNIPIINTFDIPDYYVWDLNAHTQPSPLFDSLHLVGTQYMFVKFK